MLVTLRARMRRLIDEGKSENEAVAAKPTKDFDAKGGHQGSIVTSTAKDLDIAIDAGFASHEVFTRAFRRQLGRTPTDYGRAAFEGVSIADRTRHLALTDSIAPYDLLPETNAAIERWIEANG